MKLYIFANWKMNFCFNDIDLFFSSFKKLIKKNKSIKKNNNLVFGFAPSFLEILPTLNFCRKYGGYVISQDVSEHELGAYTGQISVKQLKDYKLHYCIIGHSETRRFLGYTDQIVNNKIKILIDNNITPIICFGEPLNIYEAKQTKKYLLSQIKTILLNIEKDQISKLIFAYEPLWAIGTKITPTIAQIDEISSFINQEINKIFKFNKIVKNNIIYGGSVNENNCSEIISLPYINGLLIGNASLKSESFFKIICNSLNKNA